jgi:8-oxo-dGTP diphosphatase
MKFPLRPTRHTARGIVVHDGRLLLMERWRPGMHYFSIPGGGIEAGETDEETVAREIYEETTLTVKVERKVLEMHDGKYQHRIYLCHYLNGEPQLSSHAPELVHMTAKNRFKPGWVLVKQLPELPFTYWQPIKRPLIDGLRDGFGQEAIIVNARSSGYTK